MRSTMDTSLPHLAVISATATLAFGIAATASSAGRPGHMRVMSRRPSRWAVTRDAGHASAQTPRDLR